MNGTESRESRAAYEHYRNTQIEWASAEDLLLTLAQELIRVKEETGLNLFWDEKEEQFMRDYMESAVAAAQS